MSGVVPGTVTAVVAAPEALNLRRPTDLEVAYRRHAGELERFVARQLRDHAAAADVVQEVFVRAWRHAERYDPEKAGLRVWLFSIARNLVIDHVRSAQRRPATSTAPEDLSALGDPDHRGRSSEGDAFSDDMITAWFVEEALQALRPEQRQAIVETYIRGRPYTEVAAELSVPVGTLRSRVFYGLRTLRSIVNDMGVSL